MKNLACFLSGRNHKTYRADIADYQELLRYYADRLFEYCEDENGNPLPDAECCLKDGNGNVMVQGCEAMESKTGILGFDHYDTAEVKEVRHCSDDELQLIVKEYNEGRYVNDDVLNEVCDRLGLTHICDIRLYRSNIEVFTNQGSALPPLVRDNYFDYTHEDFEELIRDAQTLPKDADRLLLQIDIFWQPD